MVQGPPRARDHHAARTQERDAPGDYGYRATLIGGTVTFEQIFGIPGLGRHLILAVAQKDFAVVQGVALFFSIAVVTVNLIVDVSYTVLDPRART